MKASLAKFLLAIFILFGLYNKIYAQTVDKKPRYTYTVGANAFTGSVVKHDRFMGHLSQGMTNGFEVMVNKNTYGHEVWEQVFKYPDVGFSLSYFDYGSDKLGESIGGFLYVDFIFARSRKFEGIFKVGTGLAYHTNPYDNENNNQNVAVGGKLTSSMQFRLGVNYKLTDRWKLTGGLTISHFSVAAYTQPNKGVNIVTANIGATYLLNQVIPEYQPLDKDYVWDKRLKYNINFSYSLKEIPPIGGPKYPVYVLTFSVNKQISKTSVLSLGVDAFSNTALKEEMIRSDIDPNILDHKRVGIAGGYELKMNNLSIIAQFGVYIYRPYKSDKPVYQRYGLRYHVTKNLFLNYSFVTHFAKADHYEWGIWITL